MPISETADSIQILFVCLNIWELNNKNLESNEFHWRIIKGVESRSMDDTLTHLGYELPKWWLSIDFAFSFDLITINEKLFYGYFCIFTFDSLFLTTYDMNFHVFNSYADKEIRRFFVEPTPLKCSSNVCTWS